MIHIEQANRGLSKVSSNLGISLFGSDIPNDSLDAHNSILDIADEIGLPDRIFIRVDPDGSSEMAAVYDDVDGRKGYIPLIDFNLSEGSTGNAMLISFLEAIGNLALVKKLQEIDVPGIYHLNLSNDSIKKTKDMGGFDQDDGINEKPEPMVAMPASESIKRCEDIDIGAATDAILAGEDINVVIERIVRRVRGGKVQRIQVRRKRRKRPSASTRAKRKRSLRKARRFSNRPSAKRKRKRSLKLRKRRGIKRGASKLRKGERRA